MRRGVVVAIPARDEEQLLGRCLDAVLATRLPAGVERVVVVALDRCVDDSEPVARSRGVEVVAADFGGVGAARAAAVARGLDVLGLPPESVWLACTDADSVVDADWLGVHLALADGGAAMVRGTVYPDAGELSPALLEQFWAEHTRADDHPYLYGANLGVAAEAYLALGGFEPVGAHEDRTLADRAYAAGLDVRSTAQAPVMTSARVTARAGEGFSAYLAGLAARVAGSGHGTRS